VVPEKQGLKLPLAKNINRFPAGLSSGSRKTRIETIGLWNFADDEGRV